MPKPISNQDPNRHLYLCPLCQSPLEPNAQGIACENRHQFDRAKEGYFNLMPVQQKRSKDPGDNSDMMQARRRFLAQNHYHPMREAVARLINEYSPKATQSAQSNLDIGCGEGYYTSFFAEQDPKSIWHGLDISKAAIRYASKRYASQQNTDKAENNPNLHFCVASSHRLPFADNSLNAIVKIYAPCKVEELQRTLGDHGTLITVTPAPRHLYQLRELIYDEVRLHDENEEAFAGFELIKQQRLNYTMALDGETASDLLQMTPFAWKASETLWQELKQTKTLKCEADFILSLYKKLP